MEVIQHQIGLGQLLQHCGDMVLVAGLETLKVACKETVRYLAYSCSNCDADLNSGEEFRV